MANFYVNIYNLVLILNFVINVLKIYLIIFHNKWYFCTRIKSKKIITIELKLKLNFKPINYSFIIVSIIFLGHMDNVKGVKLDLGKTKAVQTFIIKSKNPTQVHVFLVFIRYCKNLIKWYTNVIMHLSLN